MDDKCLHLVPLDRLAVAWGTARRWIMGAADRIGEYNDGDILLALYNCKFRLFIAYDNNVPFGAFTAQISIFPRKTVATVVHLGSDDFEKIMTLLPKFDSWARANGAESVRIYGRQGFEKTLPEYGFEKSLICMEKNYG